MNRLLLSAAAAASLTLPQAAAAQNVPAAVIAVVDLDKVTTDCNACKTARATLQGQVTALQSREKALSAPLEAEGKSIQAAINALNGKDPDAALQARVKAFQAKREQGAEEISKQQQQIQRNSAYVSQQIQAKLSPIYQQVMQRRGANLLMEVGATLATSRAVDVTNDVLTALNTAASTLGGGAKTERDNRRSTESSNQALQYVLSCVLGQTAARFVAKRHSTITFAAFSWAEGSSSRRMIEVAPSKGRLATTLNGSRGSGTRRASPAWIRVPGNR